MIPEWDRAFIVLINKCVALGHFWYTSGTVTGQ